MNAKSAFMGFHTRRELEQRRRAANNIAQPATLYASMEEVTARQIAHSEQPGGFSCPGRESTGRSAVQILDNETFESETR